MMKSLAILEINRYVFQKCPNNAISIINLPSSMKKDVAHRFGPNSFQLNRLPVPRCANVLGLVGANGIGKSTALDILAGKIKPNLGLFDVNSFI